MIFSFLVQTNLFLTIQFVIIRYKLNYTFINQEKLFLLIVTTTIFPNDVQSSVTSQNNTCRGFCHLPRASSTWSRKWCNLLHLKQIVITIPISQPLIWVTGYHSGVKCIIVRSIPFFG